MSMRTLETALTVELREVLKNSKIRVKDMLAWSTGNVSPPESDEIEVLLPIHNVRVIVKASLDRRK